MMYIITFEHVVMDNVKYQALKDPFCMPYSYPHFLMLKISHALLMINSLWPGTKTSQN